MFRRIHTAWLAFGGSLLAFAGLSVALYWETFAEWLRDKPPLSVYCAEALRVPLEAVAKDYEAETGQKVTLHLGPSETILTNLELIGDGDLFLPADDSYIEKARKDGLTAEVYPVARMNAVLVVRKDYPNTIENWHDLLAAKRLGLANPDAAAIGSIVRRELRVRGLWKDFEKHGFVASGNVAQTGNDVRLGSLDAGIVWDSTAKLHEGKIKPPVKLPELDGIGARVQVAITKSSTQPGAAHAFLRYLLSKDHGAKYLKDQGFSDVAEGDAVLGKPRLVLYAGAMLRPAVEETINEFEKREGVRVERVYNGCGILVGQMRAGGQPDLYFACDTRFMEDVKDEFQAPTKVSSNQLVIAFRKDGKHKFTELKDLAQPGLRVGVGHEQQCALGAITKETFIRTGLYAAIRKNVVTQLPTGDFLINQIRSGKGRAAPAVDAVLVYRSNVQPYTDELDMVPITGITCAAPQQPLAVSKHTEQPELSRKLMQALQSDTSRKRFEKFGFGWEQGAAPPK